MHQLTNEQLIERAARAAHEANRVYCNTQGDFSQKKWDQAEEWQRSSVLLGARNVYENPQTTPAQSHERWLAVKVADGWRYGPVKNAEIKEHPCMVPYDELPEAQRVKDEMFLSVVRSVLGYAA